jgi:hypothetical protein
MNLFKSFIRGLRKTCARQPAMYYMKLLEHNPKVGFECNLVTHPGLHHTNSPVVEECTTHDVNQ